MYLLFQLNGKYNMQLISREAAASPAVGYKKLHDKQQAELVAKAFE
jgi:2-oxoglutarate dehydrogenase E1 component